MYSRHSGICTPRNCLVASASFYSVLRYHSLRLNLDIRRLLSTTDCVGGITRLILTVENLGIEQAMYLRIRHDQNAEVADQDWSCNLANEVSKFRVYSETQSARNGWFSSGINKMRARAPVKLSSRKKLIPNFKWHTAHYYRVLSPDTSIQYHGQHRSRTIYDLRRSPRQTVPVESLKYGANIY